VKRYFFSVKATIGLATLLLALAIAPPLPGQITGRFYPNKESYGVGEPLTFTMEIKNAGSDVVYLSAYVPLESGDGLSFSVQRTAPSIPGPACGTTWNTTLLVGDSHELKPGDRYTAQWPLDFWYRIDREGTYKANISCHARLPSLRGGIQELQFSSELRFNVVPGDPVNVEEVLQKFEADLRNPDPKVQHEALDVLTTTAPSYFHDETLRLARDKDPFKVVHAVGGLDRMNTPEGREMLAEIIASRKADSEEEQTVRCKAIEALGNSGDANYLHMLIPYAEHSSTCESEFAMIAIAKLGKGSVVSQLERFLQNPQVKQRLYAVNALRLTTSPDAVDALIRALRDEDDSVRTKAVSSLIVLTGHSVIEPNQPPPTPLQLEDFWQVWWNSHRKDTKLVEPSPNICRMQ
jgi:hypothetical protein